MLSQVRTIADVLFNDGVITQEQLNQVKFEAANTKKNPDIILIEKSIVNDEQLTKARSTFYGIPFVDLQKTNINKEVLALIDQETAKRYKAIAFEETPRGINVAMANPLDIQGVRFLETKIQKRINTYIAS